MKLIKIILLAALVVTFSLYGVTWAGENLTGRKEAPVISCPDTVLEISVADNESALLSGLTAKDAQDGDLTSRILVQGLSHLLTNDTAKASYVVFDSHGNMASASRTIRYTDYTKPTFYLDEPLSYAENASIELLDRVRAVDVIDGDITESIRISTLTGTAEPEVSTVSLQVTNSMGDTSRVTLPVVIFSGRMARPNVKLSQYLVYLEKDSTFNPRDYLVSVRAPSGFGDLANVQITDTVDTSTPGTYMVYYRYPYSITSGLSVLAVVVE